MGAGVKPFGRAIKLDNVETMLFEVDIEEGGDF